jgi:hypothetical protein
VLIWAALPDPGSGLWLVDTDSREQVLLDRRQHPSDIRDGAVSPDGRH